MAYVPVCLFSQNWATDQDSIHFYSLVENAESSFNQDFNQSQNLYAQASQIALKTDALYDYLYLLIRRTECSVYHFEYDSALVWLQSNDLIFSDMELKLDSSEQYILPRHHTDWLYYLNRMGDDINVIDLSRKLIQRIEKEEFGGVYGPYHLTIAQNYLGVALKKLGRLQEAEQVFSKGIQKSIELEDYEQRNAFYKQLGDVYALQNEIVKSNASYKKAISTNLASFRNKPSNYLSSRLVSIYQAIARNFNQIGQSDSAQYFIKQINPLITQDSFLYIPYLLQLSDFDIAEQNWQQANDKLLLALKYSQSSSIRNPSQSKIYLKLAQIARSKNQLEQAQEYITQAKRSGSKNNQFIDYQLGVEILFEEGQLMYETNAPETISKLLEATHLSNQIRLNAQTDEDRNFLVTTALPIYYYTMKVLYQQEGEQQTKVKIALRLMEETKAINLLGAIKGISENDLQLSNENVQEQALVRKEWENAKAALSGTNDQHLIDSLELEIVIQRGKYLVLEQKHRESSQTGYASRYTIDTSTYYDLLKELTSHRAGFISYMWTPDNVYSLYIDHSHQVLIKCGETKEIGSYCNLLGKNIKDPEKPFDQKLSNQLFKVLFTSVDSIMAKKLIIVPDGALHYLPFEVLTKGEEQGSFLVKDHAITYNHSASIWVTARRSNENHSNNELLSFAPTFPESKLMALNTRENLAPLLYNEKEINEVSKWMNSKVYLGGEATRSNFLDNVQHFGTIHLATHAQSFDDQPGQSFLAFSGANTENDSARLFLSEIYTLPLNAELVTLSACETGLGPIQAGEGVVSLARAFQYAGADALLTSLWKVNDETTSQIMVAFYKFLSKGNTKSEALRKAKLEYLDQLNKDNLHPAYWAGFVLYGDDEKMTNAYLGLSSNSWKITLALLGGVGLMFLFYRYSATKKILGSESKP